MDDTNILITGIGGAGFGEQILKALKISDLKLFIVGTDITDICFNKKDVDEFLTIPPASDFKYEQNIRDIIIKYNIKAIFPGSEPELRFFNKNREKFNDVYIAINSREIIELCMDKFETYERLNKLGILLPKYNKINCISAIESIDYFPVILKPSTGSGGSSHVYIAFDSWELKLFTEYMLKLDIDIVAQEYIGYDNNEYTIGISSDKNGNVISSIILKRIINNGLSTSKKINVNGKSMLISSGISQGEFIHDENIKKQAELIAKKLNSRGPINIQGRVKNDKLLIFEINPRLSGTTSLRAIVGYNEPANMIRQNILEENVSFNYSDKLILRSIIESDIT
ncbi:ATP-grasp domain-containing protein [Clostridium sp. WILCCON 0269]|uniref:ATP-grasp domain-containing protein n=1 Tax=Candidatus Clostridium eludens TaxID=3381663 RepID=A0ABW8SN64_9CLOT